MKKMETIYLVVLDSAGIGALPDAAKFGDGDVNTIGHTIKHVGKNELNQLNDLGLTQLLDNTMDVAPKTGYFGKMAEISHGKDTTTGHWELAGAPLVDGFTTYTENGFPKKIMEEFRAKTGHDYIGNYASSGTVILDELGEEHMKTKKLIVYTSADSVFQIAAHEEVVPVEELYRVCKVAREMLDKYNVARVIARPFVGKPGDFQRTYNRHDYSMVPEDDTMLDILKANGVEVTALGKIGDIFAHRGTTKEMGTAGNSDGMSKMKTLQAEGQKGLVFVNLVDFDMLYGHRRKPEGYYEALKEVDSFTTEFMNNMKDDELLIYVADHGCDPTYSGSDHTREYVPVLAYSPGLTESGTLGIRETFADISATVLDNFGLKDKAKVGTSFMDQLK